MGMKTQKLIEHREQVFADIDEEGLKAIIATAVAKEARFTFNSDTEIKMNFFHKDSAGTAVFEPYVEITLTNDLNPAPRPA
jgi:hypothetical protein